MSGVKDCGAKFGMIICTKFDFGGHVANLHFLAQGLLLSEI